VEPSVRSRKPPIDSRIERQIIVGMIVSDRFLQEICPICSLDAFQVGFARRVAGWCLDYYERYRKAPGKHIEDLYLQHKDEVLEDEATLLQSFLGGISDEYERAEEFNVQYILDKTEQYFRLNALRGLEKRLQKAVISADPEGGEEAVKAFRRPGRLKSQGVDPLRDIDFIVNALTPEEDNVDIIMRLPGDLGEAAGPLERGFLVAVQAESGVGKTWWLWLFSQLTVFAGYDTAFFSMEMSSRKMAPRIWQSVTGSPSTVIPDHQLSGDGQLLVPVFDCEKNQIGQCRDGCGIALRSLDDKGLGPRPTYRQAPKGYQPCSKCRGSGNFEATAWWKESGKRDRLDPGTALRKHAMLERSGKLKRAGRFHLVEFPSRKYTMEDLVTYLNNLEYYEGFVPSVIITDYADKLKWPVPNDPRISISQIWEAHHSLAQERHCLVVTASQSNTMRSGKQVGRGSWGETQEKEHTIEVGIAFNQSASDQAAGIMRASLVKKRHGQTERMVELVILQQLSIGRPYIDSVRLVKREEG